MTEKKATLSLCVITGNNERIMGRFLDWFMPLADEVIVVRACGHQDPDNSLRIAQERGCITGEYHNAEGNDWPHTDNFAAARQVSTDLATGDFCIWADTDDRIDADSISQIRQLLPDLQAKGVDGVLMPYVVPEDNVINWRERIWRRGKAKWINPIHECLKFDEGSNQIRFEAARITHASEVRSKSRDERNLRILDAIPEDNRTHSQLFHRFQSLIALDRNDEAVEAGLRFIQEPNTGQAERYESFFQLGILSESEESKRQCFLQALATDPSRPEAYFELGLAHCLDDPQVAGAWTAAAMRIKPPREMAPWNLRRMYFGELGISIRAMTLRAAGRHAEAAALQDNHFIRNGAKISLLHATRGRAGQAWRTRSNWMRAAANPDQIEHIFAVDADDPHAVPLTNARVVVTNGDGGPVAGWNAAAQVARGKVLVQLSDDFYPTPGWDALILDALGDLDAPKVLAVSDGHRKDDLLCMAILTHARLQQQGGVMFHPEFFSMCSDNWFSERAFADGVVIDARDSIVFEHRHPAFGKAEMDETYARSNQPYRYATGAGILERLRAGKTVSAEMDGWFDFRHVYDHVAQSLPENGGSFVEVGAWKGKSICYLADRIQDIGKTANLHVVDLFLGDEHTGKVDVFEEYARNTAGRDITQHVADSTAAAELFADGSLDGVFIDAAHDYDSAKSDIAAWLPKVKPGGFFGGHDLAADGVRRALDDLGVPHVKSGSCWVHQPNQEQP